MASAAVPVDGFGICGSLHVAEPLDACSGLRNNWTALGDGSGRDSRFVLISRGVCSFEEKVRNAQGAGFGAAIIFDDQEKSSLYSSKCPIILFLSHPFFDGSAVISHQRCLSEMFFLYTSFTLQYVCAMFARLGNASTRID